jgi:molybdenum cofactor cytidylyltransferase
MNGAIDGIVLAAGESRRMRYPKPLLKLGGLTFIATVAAAMLATVDRLVVVVGAHAERIRPAVPNDPRIKVVENPHFERGQLSSLKVGLAATRRDAAAVVVHLADHPLVRPETFGALVAEYRRTRKPIVIARCDGHRGHPVLFDRAVFDELTKAPDDQGARMVVNADPSRVTYVDVDDPGIVLDLDTPADLEKAGLAPPPDHD